MSQIHRSWMRLFGVTAILSTSFVAAQSPPKNNYTSRRGMNGVEPAQGTEQLVSRARANRGIGAGSARTPIGDWQAEYTAELRRANELLERVLRLVNEDPDSSDTKRGREKWLGEDVGSDPWKLKK